MATRVTITPGVDPVEVVVTTVDKYGARKVRIDKLDPTIQTEYYLHNDLFISIHEFRAKQV